MPGFPSLAFSAPSQASHHPFISPNTKTSRLINEVAGCATGSTRPLLGAHLMPGECLSLYHIESRSSFFSMRIMGWRRRQRACHVAILLKFFVC